MSRASALTIARQSTLGEDNDSVSSAAEVQPPPLLDSAPARPRTEGLTEDLFREVAERFEREPLPVTPTLRKLTKMNLVERVYPKIIEYLQAGHSYEVIAQRLTRCGGTIQTSTLKSYVRRIRASRSAPSPHRVARVPVH